MKFNHFNIKQTNMKFMTLNGGYEMYDKLPRVLWLVTSIMAPRLDTVRVKTVKSEHGELVVIVKVCQQ